MNCPTLTLNTWRAKLIRLISQNYYAVFGRLCYDVDNLILAVWLSGSALASINVVALRQTRLVPGWVTVCGRVNHFDM